MEAFNNKGIHSGNKFLEWVTEVLEKNGVHNMDELKAKMSLSGIHFKARAESIRPSIEHGNEVRARVLQAVLTAGRMQGKVLS